MSLGDIGVPGKISLVGRNQHFFFGPTLLGEGKTNSSRARTLRQILHEVPCHYLMLACVLGEGGMKGVVSRGHSTQAVFP